MKLEIDDTVRKELQEMHTQAITLAACVQNYLEEQTEENWSKLTLAYGPISERVIKAHRTMVAILPEELAQYLTNDPTKATMQ